MTDAVLVIKLGALGDMVQATGPFAAIRAHHPDSRLVLLTTPPFRDLAERMPWFDAVWTDDRPRPWHPLALWRLRRRLRGGGFGRVYDLQTSRRTSRYFRLMGPGRRPEWSGVAPGCSHPHRNPARDHQHTLERQAEQLAHAGIPGTPAPDVSWLGDAAAAVPPRPVLLVPGGAPHRPAKRWPAEAYAALARHAAAAGATPVILGRGPAEKAIARTIRDACPAAEDRVDATDFATIATLARHAEAAVGNDTGPMHLIAAAGAPSLVLFATSESDPTLCAPWGPAVTVIARDDLRRLRVERVLEELPGGVQPAA